jgi:ATP-dependent Lon protease
MKIDSGSLIHFVKKKTVFYRKAIQNTFLHIHKNKQNDILGISEYTLCMNKLNSITQIIVELDNSLICNSTKNSILKTLQKINNDLAGIFKEYGTMNFDDFLNICIEDQTLSKCNMNSDKIWLLTNYFHPISYKIITTKTDISFKNKNKPIEKYFDEVINNYSCDDISSEFKSFYIKVHGIKLVFNYTENKSMIIFGFLDDILIELLDLSLITDIKKYTLNNIPDQPDFQSFAFKDFLKSLTLKDYLLCKSNLDIFTKYYGYVSFNDNIKQQHITNIVKDFCKDDLYGKRNTIIMLLLNDNYLEHDYLAYLLYDILSNDTNGAIDNHDQIILFDSLPSVIKNNFKSAMKKTIQYTNDLTNFDTNKIPLEQQICLLNTDAKVKEKALTKLKEVKNKSEDSGIKARQFIEGLLKIPFNIFKKEPILNIVKDSTSEINYLLTKYKELDEFQDGEIKNTIDIFNFYNKYYKKLIENTEINKKRLINIINKISSYDRKSLLVLSFNINDILKNNKLENDIIIDSKLKKKQDILNNLKHVLNKILLHDVNIFISIYFLLFNDEKQLINDVNKLISKINILKDFSKKTKITLDKSVHSHENAKRQVQRIIGQWINNNGNSYDCQVLGFEGNPGIGKTTLAKGLSECLIDENGESRPFSIIAMGGDSNASSLIGHSYTYVGSTWGQILQILMDNKCLNPIILIDEVDKISKTEHGREIIGVLTHLLDPSQNKHFQDKYFSGIDIDLSKVLFILSYNDPYSIDPIMLDRVHRIKFDSLTNEDKIIICNRYLLPDLYKKFNLIDCIKIPDDVLKFIISEYTLEPGVRKLKENLFEIIGEINLNLYTDFRQIEIPITVTEEMIKTKYFKDKREIKITKIHTKPTIGLINALWANDMGQGGILPLQISFYPCNTFLNLKLTGSLGDVMKESINVSLTAAWNLCDESVQKKLIEKYNNPKEKSVYGLHIHCPCISTKKDGPSATTAFTVIIYSLFNNIKIKNNFGITGETSFDYKLTEIGGLREKIVFSISAGITDFIFPRENQEDFDKIMEKYKNNNLFDGIRFYPLDTISEVFDMILEK